MSKLQETRHMITIAFDAAEKFTGWGVLGDLGEINSYGVIKTQHDADITDGQDQFNRQAVLRGEVLNVIHAVGASLVLAERRLQNLTIAIERTDWKRGRSASRVGLITDGIAREALAIATSTIFGVCLELGIDPLITGPLEWKRALGTGRSKGGAAEWCIKQWPMRFKQGISDKTRAGKRTIKKVCIDIGTDEIVPDHVTDALAMGYYARGLNKLATDLKGVLP